jgi:putative membrane protein
MHERSDTVVRDRLARQRTELANERTLLSYTRTALGCLAVGIPAVWWFESAFVQKLGVASMVLGVVLMAIGIYRFFSVKAQIDREPS